MCVEYGQIAIQYEKAVSGTKWFVAVDIRLFSAPRRDNIVTERFKVDLIVQSCGAIEVVRIKSADDARNRGGNSRDSFERYPA